MNHYEILEVSPNASPEVIRAAYRSLMQRYHPDRNPDNAQTAERALRVNQAYEVLSDSTRRAAYDAALERQSAHGFSLEDGFEGVPGKSRKAAARSGALAKDRQSPWSLWLPIAAIVLAGWLMLSLTAKQQSPESEVMKIRQSLQADALTEKQRRDKLKRMDEIVAEHPEIFREAASERAKHEAARTIPVFAERLTVKLQALGPSSEHAQHVLFIPVLGIKVGSFDPERAIAYIERNKDMISQSLVDRLATAKYEELAKNDGEDYLKNIILDSLGETTATDRRKDYPPSASEAPGRYGAIDVLLPKSFVVQ